MNDKLNNNEVNNTYEESDTNKKNINAKEETSATTEAINAEKVISPEKGGTKSKVFIVVAAALVLVLVAAYLLMANYYTKHFYMNTNINGIDASGKTVEVMKAHINDELKDYKLTLEGRNDVSEVMYGYNIELNTVFNDSLDEILSNQIGYDWPKYLFESRKIDIETMIEFDQELFELNFNNLVFLDEGQVIPPEDAYVADYDGDSFKIISEIDGNLVKKDVLYNGVLEAINFLQSSLSLEELDVYEKPTIKEDAPELIKLAEDLNDLSRANITYEFGDDKEVVDGNRISEWLLVDNRNQVSLDIEGVKEFVDYIGSTYNTFGKTRTLKTSYGPVIEVRGGDYGWWLNRGKEVEELAELIESGASQVKEPSYLGKAAHYGEDDVGDTYVELNITAQHMFFYKNGQLIVESDIVSGDLSNGTITPTGTYGVLYKERHATLVGENYAAPVDYWVPFFTNIGFHDAQWRNGFGGNIYVHDGSHGCVNMPLEAARTLYENIEKGVGVYVYELSGT